MPRHADAKVIKVRDLQGKLLHYRLEGVGGSGNSRCCFARPDIVPAFEGEEAWFELERVFATPWNDWKPIRQIDPPRYPQRD